MKKLNSYCLQVFSIILLSCSISAQNQLGEDLLGENEGDAFGVSISITENGSRIIVGSYQSDHGGETSGSVSIYDWDGHNWIIVGSRIDGYSKDDLFGLSVGISSDGNRIAVGAPYQSDDKFNSGFVHVFEWNDSDWEQLGRPIEGKVNDQFGRELAMSSSGDELLVGIELNSDNGINSGSARAYRWSGVSWVQVGKDIKCEKEGSLFGRALDISDDGKRIIIGGEGNDENGQLSGLVRVYQYENTEWSQMAHDFYGDRIFSFLGSSVSISGDGNRIIMGARGSEGVSRAFEWSGNEWIQMGQDLYGIEKGEWSGSSISMSRDGKTIAIGAMANSINGPNTGQVRIYNWSGIEWLQSGSNINGEANDTYFGIALALSSNGNRIALGTPNNNKGGVRAGYVKVFQLDQTTNFENLNIQDAIFFPNPTSGMTTLTPVKYQSILFINSEGRDLYRIERGQTQLNLGHLPNGLYKVLLINDDEIISTSIIKN